MLPTRTELARDARPLQVTVAGQLQAMPFGIFDGGGLGWELSKHVTITSGGTQFNPYLMFRVTIHRSKELPLVAGLEVPIFVHGALSPEKLPFEYRSDFLAEKEPVAVSIEGVDGPFELPRQLFGAGNVGWRQVASISVPVGNAHVPCSADLTLSLLKSKFVPFERPQQPPAVDSPETVDAPQTADAPQAVDAPQAADAPQATDAPETVDVRQPVEPLAEINQVAAAAMNQNGQSEPLLQQAEADFTAAIRLDPQYVAAYQNRAIIYLRRKEFDAGIVDLNRAIELAADNAALFYNRGLAHFQRGRYDRAIDDLTAAIRLDPHCAKAYYMRGLAEIKRHEPG